MLLALVGGCAPLPAPSLPGGTPFRDCPECPELVVVEPGTFVMGSLDDDVDRWDDARERPPRQVAIGRAFAIGRYEVTRDQFSRFADATGYKGRGCNDWTGGAWVGRPDLSWQNPGFEQRGDHPVLCVSWQDAKAFTAWLSSATGAVYRLATEAEWEYAARAGTSSPRFWGKDVADGCGYANIADRSLGRLLPMEGAAPCDDGFVYTAPVGSFRPNAFGLHDMLGNVWEWTEDCWTLGYTGAPSDGSARVDGACSLRVPRGASWNSHYRNVRSSNRGSYSDSPFIHIGFRIVRDLGSP